MFKRMTAWVLLFCLLCPCLTVFGEETGGPMVEAKSACLMEMTTGKVLYEQNPHEELPLASVTKVMTILLIMEAVDSGKIGYDDMVTASEYACSMGGSQIYLQPGEQMSVRDMLKAIVVASANDGCVAMAEHLSGSEEAFVARMNERAKELGMEHTRFVNTNGLTEEGHFSSAYDIALMSRELLANHPDVRQFTEIWMDSLRDGAFGLANTNKLIRYYNGATGLKTGFTSEAMYCLSGSAERDNLGLIAVVMASPTSAERFAAAQKLLDYGFANYAMTKGAASGEQIGSVKVEKGLKPQVSVSVANDISVLTQKGQEGMERQVALSETVAAPVAKGQKVGEIAITLNGEVVGQSDLVCDEEVGKISVLHIMGKMLYDWTTAIS